jgi:putative DNA primase/helicase
LDDHIGQLQDAILAKHASLLIIDPVMAFMGGKTDTYKDSEVRRVLMPLSAMAEFTGCAIVAVTHPNKKTTESKSLFRMGGSLAFMAIARSGFVVGQDPDKEDRKIFAPTKHNLTTPAPSLAFGITSDGYLAWEDGECDITADAAMGDSADRSQVDLAKTFLFNSLSSADVLHSDIKILAESEGIANRTLYRAKALLKIVSTQLDHKGKRGGGASMWHLPKTLDE